jgi:hypothetical protein
MPKGRGLRSAKSGQRAFAAAFDLRTIADAFAALRALLRRCSAVMVFMRAFPPRLPNSARYFERMDFFIFTTA